MARMDWNKVNQPNGIDWGSRPSSDVRRSKRLKEIYLNQQDNAGKYKKPYVQRTYESSPFETNDAFEESIKKSIREEQEKHLNGNDINGYIKFTGGKYRHFNYKDVWEADSDYILWLFWNTPHSFIREQILKSVPISDNVDMYFSKIEMPNINKIPTSPPWWQY